MSDQRSTTPRPVVKAAGGYSVPRAAAPVDLHLDANEGAPAADHVLEAVADPEALRRYPDKSGLEAHLAEYLGGRPEQVVVTAGGDEAIDRVCRAFLAPGRNLVMPAPSFVMIANSARLAGADVREVPWETPPFPAEAALDAIDENTGVIALVSPNNPNGFVVSSESVRRISAAAPHVLVLLDLAYVEFAEQDLSRLAFELPNVVAVRTFSKARGLAGLRVGYAFGAARWIGVLRASGGPYPVGANSIAVASASLERGEEAVQDSIQAVRDNREVLRSALTRAGASVPPSQGNFVLADVGDGPRFRDAMAGMGISVRAWPEHELLHARSRVTVPADPGDLERLTHAVRVCLEPEAIVFDVDGVLVDVRGSYRACIIGTCAHFGVEICHDDIARVKAAGDANNDWIVSQRLLAEADVIVSLEGVTHVFEELYQGTESSTGLWREEQVLVTRSWFESLQERGYELGVVTGRPRRDAQKFLEVAGLENLFGAVVCMEDAERKPSPAPLRLAMKTMGVSTAWFLGDTVDDVRCSRSAGALPIGVVAPGEPFEQVERNLVGAGAAVVWNRVNDLERWLR